MSFRKEETMQEQEDWEKDFDAVRQYILRSPMSSEHPAIVAALHGIDQEVKRRHRDSKLQQKFSNASSITNSNHVVLGDVEMDAVKVEAPFNEVEKSQPKSMVHEEANVSMADDWQDVVVGEEDIPNSSDAEDEMTVLGTEKAKKVISLLAAHQVLCSSPTAAVAVALHALLVQYDFICTGVPETKSSVGGFAAPIRDLPVGQFLPSDWEAAFRSTGRIALRYRHQKFFQKCLYVSMVESSENDASGSKMEVLFFPSHAPFEFSTLDHFNLSSWTVAQQKSNGKISPVLHYKALGSLLAKFMNYFSLPIWTEAKKNEAMPSVESYPASRDLNTVNAQPETIPRFLPTPPVERDYAQAMREAEMHQAAIFASIAASSQGAFDRDLNPLGGLYPPDGTLFPGGNLMGPNHPIFTGGGAPPLGPPSGGMHPRFDPFGPPGGPTEPVPPPFQVDPPGKAPTFPRGGTGNPNNDLAIPPPFGGNNMFL